MKLRRMMAGVAVLVLAGCAGPDGARTAGMAETKPQENAAVSAAQETAPLVHYAVPAMSDVKRLPNTPVTDGVKGGEVKIILAKDEYEPGSFVLEPGVDLGRAQLSLTEFVNEKGEKLPAAALDLKVVKVWYQNRNAWNNYFGDTGFALCPELLLNDEDLIRVDTAKTANYARLTQKDGSTKEQWINPPRQMNRLNWEGGSDAEVFACMSPAFADADTLQPVTLKKGERKQFLLTVHATKDTPAGVYRGRVQVEVERRGGGGGGGGCGGGGGGGCGDGSGGRETGDMRLETRGKQAFLAVPVAIRVLDFTLPAPGCYSDPARRMNITFYTHDRVGAFANVNGGDSELARKQFVATLMNRVAHGQTIHFGGNVLSAEDEFVRAAMKEVGMRDVVIGSVPYKDSGFDVEMESAARRSYAAVTNALGHDDVYMGYGDETGAKTLRDQRKFFRAFRKAGYRLFLANGDKLFRLSATDFADGWSSYAEAPENDEVPAAWEQLGRGASVAWYAVQHVGSENPEFARRQNGLAPYLAGRTALSNYAHYNMPYDDDSTTYRPMCLTYAHAKGMIDTLAWEGFREGVDDIRYATLLKTLAQKAAKSDDVAIRDAGVLALQTLVAFDKNAGDLAACRREMIRHILKLIDLEK